MSFNILTLDVHAFLVTRWDGEPVNTAPKEHDDLRWFHPSELAGLTLAGPASLPSILSAVEAATV
jgi:8-oxo-dGTP diphosphatase